jgi:hypothetical protein
MLLYKVKLNKTDVFAILKPVIVLKIRAESAFDWQ